MPVKCSSPKTLARIRGRIKDIYRNHGAEIERGHFVPQVASIIFKEMRWLLNEVEYLTGQTETVPPEPEEEPDDEPVRSKRRTESDGERRPSQEGDAGADDDDEDTLRRQGAG